jgi:hypothetical protein
MTMNSNVTEKNYVVIKGAISKEQCDLLAEYARFKAKIKPNAIKNDTLAEIHREYGDPMMETILEKLTPHIEKAMGLELWPTLSFYYTYRNGNKLMKHRDRSSCQFVAGLCIGADEEYKMSHGSWPLILNNQGKEEHVALDYGDILIFRGHETEHWREPFTGQWFVSAIFGYVDKNGPFAFQKFDQRKMLGKPHVGMFKWSFGCLKQKIKNLF